MLLSLEKLDSLHSMGVLFLEYFHTTEKHSHSMELDKIMGIGFSNLFQQFSYCILP